MSSTSVRVAKYLARPQPYSRPLSASIDRWASVKAFEDRFSIRLSRVTSWRSSVVSTTREIFAEPFSSPYGSRPPLASSQLRATRSIRGLLENSAVARPKLCTTSYTLET